MPFSPAQKRAQLNGLSVPVHVQLLAQVPDDVLERRNVAGGLLVDLGLRIGGKDIRGRTDEVRSGGVGQCVLTCV